MSTNINIDRVEKVNKIIDSLVYYEQRKEDANSLYNHFSDYNTLKISEPGWKRVHKLEEISGKKSPLNVNFNKMNGPINIDIEETVQLLNYIQKVKSSCSNTDEDHGSISDKVRYIRLNSLGLKGDMTARSRY